MSIPPLQKNGYLPVGIHQATWEEIAARFGVGSPRRLFMSKQFVRLLEKAKATGHLRQVYIWGSFASAKPNPGDIDTLLVMSAEFESEKLNFPFQEVFDHVQARLEYGCDVFWVRESIDAAAFEMMLEVYQTDRDGQPRGILEVLV